MLTLNEGSHGEIHLEPSNPRFTYLIVHGGVVGITFCTFSPPGLLLWCCMQLIEDRWATQACRGVP